jgi:cytochrome c-type biogenesis protein CcmE
MTNTTWEKPLVTETEATSKRPVINLKFVGVSVVILAAAVYLIVSGTAAGARYFITVDELMKGSYTNQTVRISGAVIGQTIQYDDKNMIIDFQIANIPSDTTDLARTLYEAVLDPNAARLKIHMEGQVKPDLLQNEAQAIITGKLGADGVFVANELLLKCPSRYSEVSAQSAIDDAANK